MKHKRSHWICGLSLLLCVTLLFGMIPTVALASWADADQVQYVQEQLSEDYSEEEALSEDSLEDALPDGDSSGEEVSSEESSEDALPDGDFSGEEVSSEESSGDILPEEVPSERERISEELSSEEKSEEATEELSEDALPGREETAGNADDSESGNESETQEEIEEKTEQSGEEPASDWIIPEQEEDEPVQDRDESVEIEEEPAPDGEEIEAAEEELESSDPMQDGEQEMHSIEVDYMDHAFFEHMIRYNCPKFASTGENVTITFETDEGYIISRAEYRNSDWSTTPLEKVAENTFFFVMPDWDTEVLYTVKKLCSITVNDSEHGTVTSNKIWADADETVALTAKPEEGYVFGYWDVKCTMKNGATVPLEVEEDGTFQIPHSDADNVTVTAGFQKDDTDYTITFAQGIQYGTVTTLGGNKWKANAKVWLIVEPEDGGSLESLTITDADGNEIPWWQEDNRPPVDYFFTMPASNVTVTAVFSANLDLQVKVNWTDNTNVFVPAAVTAVLQRNNGGAWEQVQELTLNKGNSWTGSVAVQGRPEEFRFVEMDAGGQEICPTQNQSAQAVFEVSFNSSPYQTGHTVSRAVDGTLTTFTNTMKKKTLTARVAWGADVTDKPSHIDVELDIYNSARAKWSTQKRLALSSGTNWKVDFTDVPDLGDVYRIRELNGSSYKIHDAGDEDYVGNLAEYNITRAGGIHVEVTYMKVTYTANGSETVITNSDPSVELQYSVRKEWKNNDDEAMPESIMAQLQKQTGEGQNWTEVQTLEVKGESWRANFDPVEETAENRGWNYRIVELDGDSAPIEQNGTLDVDIRDAENGGAGGVFRNTYTVTYSLDNSSNDAGCTVITNTLTKSERQWTFTVQKVWEDDVYDHSDTVVRAALKKREKGSEDWTIVETIELKESGDWKGTFSSVSSLYECEFVVNEMDEEGLLDVEDIGSFKVKKDGEDVLVNYLVNVEQDPRNDYGYIITNKPFGTEYSVQKVWQDDEYSHDNTVVRAALMKKKADSDDLTTVEVLELTKSGDWKGTFSPVYTNESFWIFEMDGKDENKVLKEGETGYYTAEKGGETVMAGYEVEYDYDSHEENLEVIITNKLKPKKSFTVQKVWENDDANNHDDTVVKVELQRKEAGGGAWTTVEVLELTEAGQWKGEFKPLVSSDSDEFRVCEQDGKGNLLTDSGMTGYFEVENVYPDAWQSAWHAYEVDYDFDEEENEFTVINRLKENLVISADLKWDNDNNPEVSDEDRIYHEKPVTVVLRQWDDEQGGWVEKEEIQLTKVNNWKGTFSNNEISVDDRWEVREKDKDGNLVENDGALVPFTVTQGGAEKQENYAVKYSVFDFDPLNPVAVITNKGNIDRADCKIKLVWEDGEEGVSHKPVLVNVVKICRLENYSQVEDPVGEADLNNDNGWETTLYTNNNTFSRDHNEIARISCEFINDEGHPVNITDSVVSYEEPVSKVAGKFTCYKNGEPFSYTYKVTSTTTKRTDNSGRHFTTTITLTRENLGMRTSSVRIDWLEEPPAGYKPESLTAQLLHREYTEEEAVWVAKDQAVLNNNNNWAHTFDPLPDDGDEENYLIDLLGEDGERLHVNEGIYSGNPFGEDMEDPLFPGFTVMKCRVRKVNGVENIVEYAVNAPKSENNLTTIQCGILGRYFSVRNIRIEEPPVKFADGDTPVRSTYILQHGYGDEWIKVSQTIPEQPEDGKFFEIRGQWNDDNYRVREIDEEGNAVEENGTIVLSARKDGTPLHLQYRVNYGAYGQFQAGEFPVTKTLQGQIFPVEIEWEGAEAPDSVEAVLQSSPKGENNWSIVEGSTVQLNEDDIWKNQIGPVPYDAGKEYRVRELVDGKVIEGNSAVEIDGKTFKVTYQTDYKGLTTITNSSVKTHYAYKNWVIDGLDDVDGEMGPQPVAVVLQYQENGSWQEVQRQALSYDGDPHDDHAGAEWRHGFQIAGEDDIQDYRVREIDAKGSLIEEGGKGIFQVRRYDGSYIDAEFQVSYTFNPGDGSFDITNTYAGGKTDLGVNLVWDDQNNKDGLRPEKVTVKLLADGADTGKTLELTQEKAADRFTGLDKNNQNGAPITYTVQIQQDNVITGQDGKKTYASDIQGSAEAGYTVTLKHTPQTVSYTVKIDWQDSNDQDGKRPASIDAVLMANNQEKRTENLTEQNQWSGRFQDLPAVENGQEINYSVTGRAAQNYQMNAAQQDNSYTITYKHDPEKITISGTIQWNDKDKPQDRPATVTIHLKANGQEKDSKTFPGTGSQFSFPNVDKYANKQEIDYSVSEDEPNNYTVAVNGASPTFSIMNTHKDDNDDDDNDEDNHNDNENAGDGGADDASNGFWELLKKIGPYVAAIVGAGITIGIVVGIDYTSKSDLSGKVTWNHGDNPKDRWPEWCTVQLLADGEIVEDQAAPLTVYRNPDWTYTFKDVPKYRKGTTATTYTVTSNAIKDYTATYDGMNVTYTYTPGKIQANVNIVWDDVNNQDGIRPESVDIKLTNGSSINKTVTLTENGNWAGSFTDLDVTQSYKADVVRTDVINGTNAAGSYAVTASGDQETGFFFKLTHTPSGGGVTGNISWEDNDNTAGRRPEKVTVTLMARLSDGSTYDMSTVKDKDGNPLQGMVRDVTAKEDWKVTFSFDQMPVAADGGPIEWFLKEEPVEGYLTAVNGMTVTNTLDTSGVVSLSGTVAWEDENNKAGDRPDKVTLRLLADGTAVDNQVKTVTAGEDQQWKWSFTDLPEFKDGKAVTYSVSEDAVPDYTTTYGSGDGSTAGSEGSGSSSSGGSSGGEGGNGSSGGEDGNGGANVVTVINTYAPETRDLMIQKTWDDADDAEKARPESITVHLFADEKEIRADGTLIEAGPEGNGSGNNAEDGNAGSSGENNAEGGNAGSGGGNSAESGNAGSGNDTGGITIQPDERGGWSLVLPGLRRYKAGKEISYTITEDPVPEYRTSIDGLNITNTYAHTTLKVEGSAVWEDQDDAEGQRPDNITIRLYADGEELEDQAKTVTADENGDWKWTFTGLPRTKTDEEGNTVPVTYTITEDPLPDYTESVNGFNVTNTFKRENRKVSASVQWDDGDDQDGIRPDSVTLRLLADGEPVEGKTAEVSALQDWKYSFTGLPRYEKGVRISYAVEETTTDVLTGTDGPGTYGLEMVTGADAPGGEAAASGFIIKNTHTPETVDIEGSKTWQDGDNAEGSRPDSITIRLLADGKELQDQVLTVTENGSEGGSAEDFEGNTEDSPGVGPEGNTEGGFGQGTDGSGENTEGTDGGWKWAFRGLPKYKEGREVVYSIREDSVEDYTSVVDGFNVTNTYTPGKTQADVVLSWDDDNDRDGIRPDQVTIELWEDGDPTGKTLELSEANKWQGSFTELDSTKDGAPVLYSAGPERTDVLSGEDEPGSYAVNMNIAPPSPGEKPSNYYAITFVHTPETVDPEGVKTWVDDDNYDGTRPENIRIRLLADGTATGHQETVTADENGEWKWRFTGLPKNEDGKEIVYSVYEDAVKNYTTVINGMNVTNTLSAEPAFKTYAMLLTGLIGVNVYMDLPGRPEKYEDSYMVFTVNGKEETAYFDSSFRDSTKQYYGFTGHINSIQMAEPITCTYHYSTEEGEKTIDTVVKASGYIDQCAKIFAYNPDVVALLKALGNYGHYVQPYLSEIRHWTIGTDFQEMPGTSEITSDMIQSVREEVKAYALSTTKGTDSKVALSYSLNLETGTLIYIHVKPEEGTEVSAKLDGKGIEADHLENGYYRLTIPSIPAHELSKIHTINVTAGEENVDINVCALSYVNTILNPPKGSYSQKAKEAVTSLFNYYRAAANYIK